MDLLSFLVSPLEAQVGPVHTEPPFPPVRPTVFRTQRPGEAF